MDIFETELNKLLVDTYRSIERIEESAIKNSKTIDLSISEMHLLDETAKHECGITIGNIAKAFNITLPSVTIAISKLEKKGYVEKVKRDGDGRKVYVKLTRLGEKTGAAHRFFHEQMVRNISQIFSQSEGSCY